MAGAWGRRLSVIDGPHPYQQALGGGHRWRALGGGRWVVDTGKCYKETAAWKPEDTVTTIGIPAGWTPRIPYILGPQGSH